MKPNCYKVVFCQNQNYFSSYVDGKLKLQYKIGETTFPEVGKIFVFGPDHIVEAVKYTQTFRQTRIFEAYGENLIQAVSMAKTYNSNDVKQFWENYFKKESHYHDIISTFSGTYYTDSVTLLKELF